MVWPWSEQARPPRRICVVRSRSRSHALPSLWSALAAGGPAVCRCACARAAARPSRVGRRCGGGVQRGHRRAGGRGVGCSVPPSAGPPLPERVAALPAAPGGRLPLRAAAAAAGLAVCDGRAHGLAAARGVALLDRARGGSAHDGEEDFSPICRIEGGLSYVVLQNSLEEEGSSLLGALNLDPQSVRPDLLSLFAWCVGGGTPQRAFARHGICCTEVWGANCRFLLMLSRYSTTSLALTPTTMMTGGTSCCRAAAAAEAAWWLRCHQGIITATA